MNNHIIEKRENKEMAKRFDNANVLYIPVPYYDEIGKDRLMNLSHKLLDELLEKVDKGEL